MSIHFGLYGAVWFAAGIVSLACVCLIAAIVQRNKK